LNSAVQTSAGAATTVGRMRATNEDRYLLDVPRGLFAIADGIGGLPYGERASECAIRSLIRQATPPADPGRPLAELVAACHDAVGQLGRVIHRHMGIGTTLTLLRIGPGCCEIAHVGDSAAFIQRGRAGEVVRLTTEHTSPAPAVVVVGLAPAAGFLPPATLERYLGQSAPLSCETHRVAVSPGDRIILCSDGVICALDPADLAALSVAQPSPLGFAQALIHVANVRGGRDNATAIVIDFFSEAIPPSA
jgi:serine/threonine protein phosphatase PrpC